MLTSVFEQNLQNGEILIYGSRAKGNFSPRSDIDFVIKNNEFQNQELIANIKNQIEESDIPYLVDIPYFESIDNKELINHINRVGKRFYKKL